MIRRPSTGPFALDLIAIGARGIGRWPRLDQVLDHEPVGPEEADPLADASFDIVFCDHDAMTFADPYRTVPEAARLLRDGGLFAFNHASTVQSMAWAADAERAGDRLVYDYFGMHRLDYGDSIDFNLPYGSGTSSALA